MSEQQSPAPGWYPQPDGTQRWWDGSAWTEHLVAPTPTTRKIAGITFGTGSEVGSLVAAILCLVLLPGVALIAVAASVDGNGALAVVGAAGAIAIAVFATLGFGNYWVLRSARLQGPQPPTS